MASKVSDLINKLKREMPELENNPLLDEIEMAAHDEGAADQGQGLDEEDTAEAPEMPGEAPDAEDMAEEPETSDEEAAMKKAPPFKKKAKGPAY